MVKRLLFVIAVLLYAASVLWLSFGTHAFASPDENANAIFARTFGTSGEMRIVDEINVALDGAVHPRSVVGIGTYLVPGSFLGLPVLAGLLSKFFGDASIVLLTPLLAFCALLAWWGITRRLGGEHFAYIATALLALHPAFWYWTSRSMMHNVPFVCMLIFAAWIIVARPLTNLFTRDVLFAHAVEWCVAGLFVGTALFIRTSEAPWVLALTVVAFVVREKCGVKNIPAALCVLFGIALPLCVMFIMNNAVYGSPFTTGYTIQDTAQDDIGEAGSPAEPGRAPRGGSAGKPELHPTTMLTKALLPFGFHPRAVLRNVWNFGLGLFPWMTAFAIVGMVSVVRSPAEPDPAPPEKRREERGKTDSDWRMLLWVTLGLSVWLGVVYGSWSFHDNPDPTAVTIVDSHTRYWLPLFVLSTLFAAKTLTSFFVDRRSLKLFWASIVLCAALSVVVVFGGDDGLLHTRSVLIASAQKRDAVVAATEDNAIIVVDRADKFLWPSRRVIQPLRSDATYATLPIADSLAPLYYYGIPFPESDMTYLNDVKLAALGLRMTLLQHIGDEALYRIVPVVGQKVDDRP